MEDLSLDRIQSALARTQTGDFGQRVHFYKQIGSTNDAARDLAAEGAPEGTLVIADEQTAGRGRMARVWTAPPGTSLLMSILFRPTLPPADAYRLVMVTGLAYADACEAHAGVRADIKWPNDVQIGGKKLAGILPESAIEGDRLRWVIVGVGLNVNQHFEPPDPLAEEAVSLRMACGRTIDRAALLGKIAEHLSVWAARLHDPALIEAWRARCITLGQQITVTLPNEKLEGVAESLDPSGALWLRTDDGQRRRLTIGEATLSQN